MEELVSNTIRINFIHFIYLQYFNNEYILGQLTQLVNYHQSTNDNIKDGLLKLMLYNNLSKIETYDSFKIILRLTSSLLQDSIILPNENLDSFIKNNTFSSSQIATLKALNMESKQNHFEVWINNEY